MTLGGAAQFSGSPLPERTDFGPYSVQLDRPIYIPASRCRAVAFIPQCSPATTHDFYPSFTIIAV